MSDQIERLSAKEYEVIGNALWELVKSYPREMEDPNVIAQYDALGAESSLAVLVDGGRYKKKYISGSFIAEVNFRVAYKSSPTTSPDRIDAQAFVGRIVSWLETTNNLPLLTDSREITKITLQNMPYKYESETDKSIVYAANAVMEYIKKGA